MGQKTLSKEVAERIASDYKNIIGKTYKINGRSLTVSSLKVEPSNQGNYTVIVYFELIAFNALPMITIDEFCYEVGIDFDLDKYIGS